MEEKKKEELEKMSEEAKAAEEKIIADLKTQTYAELDVVYARVKELMDQDKHTKAATLMLKLACSYAAACTVSMIPAKQLPEVIEDMALDWGTDATKLLMMYIHETLKQRPKAGVNIPPLPPNEFN